MGEVVEYGIVTKGRKCRLNSYWRQNLHGGLMVNGIARLCIGVSKAMFTMFRVRKRFIYYAFGQGTFIHDQA